MDTTDLSLFGASKKKSFLASAKLLEESAIWLSHVFPTRSWIGLKFCSGQNLPLKQDCRDQNVSDLLCLHFFQPFFPPIQVKRQQMHEYNRSCVWITVNSRDILDWITPRRFEWWLKGRKGNSKVVFLPTCARERG